MAKNSNKCLGKVRIIAGRWRSLHLPVLTSEGLRPTSDRMRETLFNWLDPYLNKGHCLDCFSGSGALAFEALSRCDDLEATLLEKAPKVAKQLQTNLNQLQTPKAKVINTDALIWLKQPAKHSYDLIFLDPPFKQNLLELTAKLLDQNGYLHAGSLIYVETPTQFQPKLPTNWRSVKEKSTTQANHRLYQTD